MRLGAWLCVGALCLTFGGGCSGGYSLPPTPCDDWCHVTQGSYGYSCSYGYYDPANCVSQCEAEELSNEHCTAQFQASLACYQSTPGATTAACYYNPDPFYVPPCRPEYDALASCTLPYLQSIVGLPPGGPSEDLVE